jgi:hypothetical protein
MPPPPSESWLSSTLTEEGLEDMEARGLLQEKAVFGWNCYHSQEFPLEDRTEAVVFWSFYEKGFGLTVGAFFRRLLKYYRLEAIHLKPNSIALIAIFIHLCEGFLGIPTHFNLWRALYHLRTYPSKEAPSVVGGAAFSLHQGVKYLEAALKDSNKRWPEE